MDAPPEFREWCSDVIGGTYSSNSEEKCLFEDDGFISFSNNKVEYYHTTDLSVEYHRDTQGEVDITSLIEGVRDSFILNDGTLVVETEYGVLVLSP